MRRLPGVVLPGATRSWTFARGVSARGVLLGPFGRFLRFLIFLKKIKFLKNIFTILKKYYLQRDPN